MDNDNIYSIRCQLHNHKGPGFVIEITEKDNEFVLQYQSDENNPNRERVRIGRIDFDAPFETVKLQKSDVERIISKAKEINVPFLPPITGGFDGADQKLWILNGMSVVHVSWWLDCPPQWKQFQELWELIIETRKT